MTRYAFLQDGLVIWVMSELTVIMTIYAFVEARQVTAQYSNPQQLMIILLLVSTIHCELG